MFTLYRGCCQGSRSIIPIFIFDMCGNPGNPDTEKLGYNRYLPRDKEKKITMLADDTSMLVDGSE